MASVQAPPAVHHAGSSAMTGQMTQQQVQEVYMKFRQMKEQGVPQTDPEFMKMSQFLMTVQQQQQMRKQQQNYMQMQAAQMSHNAPNGNVNGTPTGPRPQQPNLHTTQPPSSAALNASALSSSTGPTVQPIASSPSTASPMAAQFSQQQLGLLRQQIQAFKLLSKNAGVPYQMQQALNAQRQRRQAVAEQSSHPPTHSTSTRATPAPEVTKADSAPPEENTEPKDSGFKSKTFKTLKSPYEGGLVRKEISYHDHTQRKQRLVIPSIFPTGVDFEQLRHEREIIIFNRMKARYAELKSLPGNISHWDTTRASLDPDDTLKRKAVIELKSLGLYAKQRALRERIGRAMMHYDNLAMTTNRSQYRRTKKQSVREARITEKLEKQQRDARETREKKKHIDFLQAVQHHKSEIFNSAHLAKNKMSRIGRAMHLHHFNIEKEEQKRIERTAKQRLQALKANDEEAYLKLLDQAKDTRITHLLKQTDGFLHQLASSVKAQQRQAAQRYGEETGEYVPEEESEVEEEDEEANKKIDYYAVAHRIKEDVTEQANILVGGTLKEYQIKGLQWMLSLYNNNLNGILADEMGLGKTIQTISLITYLIERKLQQGPYLVIVPLSTLTNWNLEFEKWAPSVSRVVYKGPPNARKQQQEKIRQGKFQVLLTTYEYIIKDRPVLSKIKWFHMIIDEGHRMKNTNSKLSATISQYYNTRFRLILTGTPLQNNLGELWAMLNFVLPNIFKSVKTFDEWFNTPFANTGGQDKMELNEEEQILVIRRLHKVLRPFLLRRLKKDVEKDLPDKTEKVIKCKFSALQTRLYKQMVTHQKITVSDGKGGKTGTRGLSNMIMQLRKLCNHPFVFDEVENQMNPMNTSNDLLWRTAGKFELLDRILPKYRATGHRVLMFFQMTAIMDIMEDFLRFRGIQYLRLDGTTKSEDRSDLLKTFNAPDSPYFMFLLSTRAGGLGLNLQTADTVIIYDSDWNPHQDLQAQDRAHRIGQKNEVRILRLISSNSVEEKILERARYKLDMDGKVIQAGRFDNKSSETDRDAMLRTLLESADMADSAEQDEMDDEELNLILARSDDEVGVFQKLDEERAKDLTYGNVPGSKRVPRLMAEDELPEIYLSEGNPVDEEQEEVLGRGARERTRVKYDDGLTEEQWLMAVDDDEDSPEAAAARKQARKDKRETNKLKRLAVLGPSGANSPVASRASTEEIDTPPKKRGRKPGSKNEKRKAEDDDGEPPAKKRRGPQGRPRAIFGNGNDSRISFEVRQVLQRSLRNIYDGLMGLEADIAPEDQVDDDDDDEPTKRLIIGPFIKLPSKRDYGDYYVLIQNPICMNQIMAKIKKEEYNSINDMRRDIVLMCNNCRTYNEDGSLLYSDAIDMEKFFNARAQQEINEHPELGELEDPFGKDSSVPPTSAGTPQSSANTTRIKLVTNGASQGGMGAGGALSDGEQ
ncbi:chromatin remodeling complex SWI/SNF, component SWI2 and related ATPase [Annulohypoxylon maeteangense]|uniref:chromatin remodeling complex SWI/SNF, component SWI2 and related ATPase n=1 Tax=Annulohypoxylon maeteangense TaxID=1927788 RepID=UPI0020085BA0|nr:chromatin remodeling complex SWI/SNF, component SWI2 and related ATPase [Annulohypoxylon maeteangense]KAI0883436.1 chromatin remodeling complex SWI/SNF, component SWI2 and related ATPase [Annulohypoxylon maeteangense]